MPRPLPYILTLLFFLLTGWFPAASRLTGGIVPAALQGYSYQLSSDTYDANGNTTSSLVTSHPALGTLSATDVYSFDNKLIRRTRADGLTIDLTYNPDGHRLTKLVSQSGLTQRLHHYLTDPNNPTGYSQVVEEKDPLAPAAEQLKKVHLYGHDLIATSSSQPSTPNPQLHFYTYDGLGSIRGITDESGELQETYDYDAYGTLIGLVKRNASSGELESQNIHDPQSPISHPTSEYLFTGEQWDSDLGMYFLRARYLNTQTGRFHTQDTYEGRNGEPLTLHKYLYVHGNPVMNTDPSGNISLGELATTTRLRIQDFASFVHKATPYLNKTLQVLLNVILYTNIAATAADAASNSDYSMMLALTNAIPYNLKLLKDSNHSHPTA